MMYILISVWLIMLIYFVSYEIINFIIPNILHKPNPKKGIAVACSFGVMFMHLFIACVLFNLLDPLIEMLTPIYIDIALYFNLDTVTCCYFTGPTILIIFCLIQYIFFKAGLKEINKIRKRRIK